MDSGIITIFLPIALAIIMAGLGLELLLRILSVLQNILKQFSYLFCQLVILVSIAFVICKLLALPPLLVVGVMLLAASPGGTANLFSYLYKGDIALNITLTAINSVIAAFTLPFIVNLSIQHFINDGQQLGLQFSKVIQVFLIIIVPVCLGMLVRYFSPNVADKLHKPVRTFAVVFLILIIIGAVAKERNSILEYIMQVGLATSLFCIASLLIGYFIPRIFGISSTQARACAFEIGIHNSTLV